MDGKIDLYCDGGLIGANPSRLGGTWACVIVTHGVGHEVFSGIVTPADAGMGTISNNYTELEAAVQALERAPAGWTGVIHTDSNVTRCRLIAKKPKMKGIPGHLQERLRKAKARVGAFTVVLLDGHPTPLQLMHGKGKRGNPVSAWNVKCDAECTRLANQFKSRLAAVPA